LTSPSFRTLARTATLVALLLLPASAFADPIVVTPVPIDESVGQGPIDLATPPVPLPATCSGGPCDEETPTPERSAETPPVDPRTVTTPPVPVPAFCLPPDPAPITLLCGNGTEVHPQSLGPTPGVDSEEVTVESQTVPAVCDAAGEACIGPITIGSIPVATTPGLTVALETPGLAGFADAHAGELVGVGPFSVTVPGTDLFNETTYTVCPDTCPVHRAPEGGVHWTLTVTYGVGDEGDSVTIPLDWET
jgi:hypothetical protein